MKILKVILVCSLLYTYVISSQAQINRQILQKISNDLDNLVGKLTGKNIQSNGVVSQIDSNALNQSSLLSSGNNLSNSIYNAFNSLNIELADIDSLLSGKDKKESLKLNENSNDSPNPENFLDEAKKISDDISSSVEMIENIEKNKNKLVNVETKIETLNHLKREFLKIKTDTENIVSDRRKLTENITKYVNKILNIYYQYLKFDETVKSKLKQDLENLEISMKTKDTSNDISQVISQLYKFNKKFQDEIPNTDNNLETYNSLFIKIVKIDHDYKVLKLRAIQNINNILSKQGYLNKKERSLILFKYSNKIKQITILNDSLIQLKSSLIENLGQFSFEKVSDILKYLESKKDKISKGKSSIANMKKTLEIVQKIFKEKENIKSVKQKLIENIGKIEEKAKSIKIVEEYRKKLIEMLQGIKNTKNKIGNNKEKISIISKITKFHNKIVSIYTNTVFYANAILKIKTLIKNEKEATELASKYLKIQKTVTHLKQLVVCSKTALDIISKQGQNKTKYDQVYQGLINKLIQLKNKVQHQNSIQNHLSAEDYQELIHGSHIQIQNLAQLYKYLKVGNSQEYVRNKILRNIVNMNESLLDQMDLNKLALSLKINDSTDPLAKE